MRKKQENGECLIIGFVQVILVRPSALACRILIHHSNDHQITLRSSYLSNLFSPNIFCCLSSSPAFSSRGELLEEHFVFATLFVHDFQPFQVSLCSLVEIIYRDSVMCDTGLVLKLCSIALEF